MNKVILLGRNTRDPEVRYTQGENAMAIARGSIAVNRRFKREGEADADFISYVAFGKTAEFIEKYFHKGDAMAIVGRWTTGSYTNKDGVKIYTNDVTVEEVDFAGSKSDSNSNASNNNASKNSSPDGFMNIPDGIDEELPFN